tara:strand:+ start:505 stop:861 length:357 start_codon:yes stop_codon:yes gene_type:complete
MFHYKNIIYLSLFHILAFQGLVSLIYYYNYKIYIEIICLTQISGLGITAGAHRLWSHRSYKAKFTLRCFLMILISIANQGSIIHWSRDHRLHHRYSDTDLDPHNINRGFFIVILDGYL